MTPDTYRFDRFTLDMTNRQLTRDGAPVEVSARYLDALALLVRERGKLVSKDRFLDEVWDGVPVTDEALTQCIKTLRKQLGDDAARPRFIETVVKHGYRFVGSLDVEAAPRPAPTDWGAVMRLGLKATGGAGVAGLIEGIVYGFAVASQPSAPESGSLSAMLVVACLTVVMAVVGGAGVGFGTAAGKVVGGRLWTIAGGAVGGLIVGALVRFLGQDAFVLLFGRAPGAITGAFEGLCLGAAVGLSLWAGERFAPRWHVAMAAVAGAVAGLVAVLSGGRLMGGSLLAVAQHFPGSRLGLDALGIVGGEAVFGPVSQTVMAGFEGAVFCVCVAGAMAMRRKAA